MRLHSCEQCGGPRRSLTQFVCSRCRKHPKDACPECGGEKGIDRPRCLRCHAAANARASGPSRRRRVTLKCEHCAKEFEVKQALAARRFCSRPCRDAGLKGVALRTYPDRVLKTCLYCGNEFSVPPSLAILQCCSRGCTDAYFVGKNHPGWKGGAIRRYGPTWPAAQAAVRARDKTCRVCNATRSNKRAEQLTVHHIRPFRDFGIERHEEANVLSNLILLCSKCHRFAHSRSVKPRLPL